MLFVLVSNICQQLGQTLEVTTRVSRCNASVEGGTLGRVKYQVFIVM